VFAYLVLLRWEVESLRTRAALEEAEQFSTQYSGSGGTP
jgi:hypothetical protein